MKNLHLVLSQIFGKGTPEEIIISQEVKVHNHAGFQKRHRKKEECKRMFEAHHKINFN